MSKIQVSQPHWEFIQQTENQRYSILFGGRRSSKTYSRLIWLYYMALKEPLKIQIIGSTSPIIKAGCLSDFERLFGSRENIDFEYNRSNLMFKFRNNSTIQFICCDNAQKALQLGRADYRFINEMNNISKDTFDNLSISTERQISGDFNPVAPFYVDEISTPENTAKFNYPENPFLSKAQIEQFKEWERIGQVSKVGSPAYWRWQCYCLGNYCSLAGDMISVDDLRFTNELPKCLRYIGFCDPASAHGYDNIACCLVGQKPDGNLIMIDSLSFNKGDKRLIYDKLKEWKDKYPSTQLYCERNGIWGQRFYNDCLSSGLSVMGFWQTENKQQRIFANLDIIKENLEILDTEENLSYVQQWAAFDMELSKENLIRDDNLDALNSILVLLQSRRLLKKPLFI